MTQLKINVENILTEIFGSPFPDLDILVNILHEYLGEWKIGNTSSKYYSSLGDLVTKGLLDFKITNLYSNDKIQQLRWFKTSEWLTETIEAV